ncbi:MAG TPA: hypothetical protein VF551_07995, partial [Chthoniobacterales bacterium]
LARPDLSLDPTVAESFRARNSIGQGATLDADLHWERALGLASGDPFKLRFVANFAEQSRATPFALKAFEQLARFPEHAAFAQRGRQRLLEQTGDASAARGVAERLAVLAPDDVNAQAQLVHLNLLLGVDVPANVEKAKALAAKYPTRLSFRVTAALGHLRQHDATGALAQFNGPPIEWEKTPPPWRAVYAAALAANEQLARFPEHAAFAQRGRQRLLEQTGDASAARGVAERLAVLAPDDVNAQAQLVHLNLLLGVDVPANVEKAKALAAKYPTRLSFRVTAALAHLRQHDATGALAQFNGPPIEWEKTPPPWRAVYAAALAANDQLDPAREVAASIPRERLNKEERELIASISSTP